MLFIHLLINIKWFRPLSKKKKYHSEDFFCFIFYPYAVISNANNQSGHIGVIANRISDIGRITEM